MIDLIVGVICLVAALGIVMIRKAYFALPIHEIKRRAVNDDTLSKTIYPVVAYGSSLRSFLWLVVAILSAVGLTLLVHASSALWLGIVITLFWLGLIFSWLPNSKLSSLDKRLASLATPLFIWLLGWSYPLLKELDRMLRFYAPTHSGIYEPSDLHQLLVRQTQQPDNRIKTKQLGRISQLLEFETSTVSDYSRPWKRSMKLVASDPVGPKLLDEMHRSSQGVFAVIAGKSSREVVGLLNKDDIGLKSAGLIRDHMHGIVETINEDEPIEKSLAKFALSGQALLIVISSADEFIGTITLRDALSSLLAEDNLEEDAVAPTEEVEVSSDVPMLNLEQGGLNESS